MAEAILVTGMTASPYTTIAKYRVSASRRRAEPRH
jgi:hypothetical protein